MTQRDTLISELTKYGLTFIPAAPTPGGLMQYIGTTASRMTTVQLLGPADRLVQIEALLGLPKDAHEIARFNGQLAAVLLGMALPTWKDAARWVGDAASKTHKRSPLKTEHDGVAVALEYRKRQGTVVMRITWPQATT